MICELAGEKTGRRRKAHNIGIKAKGNFPGLFS
jgi:hypothetical protein